VGDKIQIYIVKPDSAGKTIVNIAEKFLGEMDVKTLS